MNRDGTIKRNARLYDTVIPNMTLTTSDWLSSVTAVGDVDGDGVVDLAIGALGEDDGGSAAGAVYIVFMNRDGSARDSARIVDADLGGALDANDELGHDITSMGDFDGNGVPDIAVSTWSDDDGGSAAGALYIIFLNNDGSVK